MANKRRLAKESTHAQNVVVKDSNDASRDDVYSKAIHYTSDKSTMPEGFLTVANVLKGDIIRRNLGEVESVGMIKNSYEVQKGSGYFRAHIDNDALVQLNSLPGCFQIKESASQKCIVFFNNKDGQCDCHFDRDSSMLYLVYGHKEVKIALPMNASERPADGILQQVDPFSPNTDLHGGYNWTTVYMKPGEVNA